jgi:REP element-mobilizing transposase RayT
VGRTGWEILTYVWMPNHIHLFGSSPHDDHAPRAGGPLRLKILIMSEKMIRRAEKQLSQSPKDRKLAVMIVESVTKTENRV